ncbi:MAG: VPLPA-CTERM sorting domain-containing protein [Methylococcales bacterium]|nr:VPLPA-CTERM sorting domain-containing protein [Methylococcales bacterium]
MKKNILALMLTLFLFPMVSNAAIVSIENNSTSGTGTISNLSVSAPDSVSTSHSGINGVFEDFWTVSLDSSSETFSIASSIPEFELFTVEYRLNDSSPWIGYDEISGDGFSETVTANIENLSGFQLHIFGNSNNPLGLIGTYQLTINDVNSVSNVPVPAAVWLFGSALMGLVGVSRRKSSSVAA